MAAQNTDLLLVVDIQTNNARLAELSKEARTAKEEFANLQKQVKAGKVDADLLDTASVKLKNTLAANAQETRTLTAANAAQIKATQASAGSIEQLRAQLSLGTAEYNKLSAAERDNTEAGQQLQSNNKMLSDNLKILEGAIGDTRRNVGNYGAAIEPVIAELVKLQEVQKRLPEGTQAYEDSVIKVKGFQQAVNEAGIKAGLTYDQTQAKLAQVGEAVRPVVKELIELEQEQEKVAQGSDAYTQIGFKIGQANKAIEHTTSELKKAPPEAKKLSTGLFEAAQNSDLFGGAIGKATDIQDKFVKAQELAKLATGGWTGALGVLRVALIATGIGALVVVLGSVITYLTKTVEGSQLLTTVLDQVGAVVNVIIDRFGTFGKAITQVLSGDVKGAAATATSAFKGIGDELQREVKIAGDLSKARQQLDRDTAKNIDTNKRLLNEVERLKNVRDNEFNTIQQRQRANEEAYRIELQRENTLADLARRKIAILQAEIDLRGGESKVSLEQLRAFKEAQNELSDIQEDAAGKQNELITNRFQLNKEKIEQEAKLREDAIKADIASIQTRLLSVRLGSEQELALRQQLIRRQADLEKAGADKTAADRKLILAKALQDELKLDEDFDRARQERARKFLDDQDKARATALSYQQSRLADAAKEQDDSYKQNEALLARNLARRRAQVEDSYADGIIDKKKYDAQVELLEENRLGAELVLLKVFGRDTSKVEEDIAKLRRARAVKTREEERAEYAERLKVAEQFGGEIGQLFADTLADSGATLEDFAAKALILILSTLEQFVLAEVAKTTARNIGEAGYLGLIKAGLEAAAITVAFEGAKAAISAASAKPFNAGGIVPGAGNTADVDSTYSYLTPGEAVMTRQAVQEYGPVLGYLNSLAGGVNFAPGFRPTQPVQIDGGLMQRQIGNSAQAIDYEKLTRALERANLYSSPNEMGAAIAKKAKIKALFSLG